MSAKGAKALKDLIDGLTRSSTIKIAASNATPESKSAADYVCDGTADEVEINGLYKPYLQLEAA